MGSINGMSSSGAGELFARFENGGPAFAYAAQ
jgi:hypothetical protein